MNIDNTKKNCFLVLRNKKLACFDWESAFIKNFSDYGYYFDRIIYVAYDSSFEITTALKQSLELYENLVICCPCVMEQTLKKFISTCCAAEFDGLNTLLGAKNSVYMFFYDCENRLTVKDVCEALNKKYGLKYEKAFIRTVGAPQTAINSAITSAKEICKNCEINVTEQYGDCTIEIIYDSVTPKTVFDDAYRAMVAKLGDYIYALEDIPLAERLVQVLKLRRMKICVAESFTGGGIAKRLVEISGVSEVYFEGLNTYSNESKMQRLGVDELTLSQYGAVSAQTATQMAQGLLNGGNCDISIATTGIAGPKSDNTKKPVGMAFIAVGYPGGTQVNEYDLKGSRKCITETAINLALFSAFKLLK